MRIEPVDWSTIPVPEDDGAADHLTGRALPAVILPATDGTVVDISKLTGRTVLYCYPMTGTPGTDLPEGWNALPGARGCTPQSCSYRDHFAEMKALGVDAVYGISTQSPADQTEAATRLKLPFPLLSDEWLALGKALDLPMMEVEGRTMLRRITLVAERGYISALRYPVFPPDEDATEIIALLKAGAS